MDSDFTQRGGLMMARQPWLGRLGGRWGHSPRLPQELGATARPALPCPGAQGFCLSAVPEAEEHCSGGRMDKWMGGRMDAAPAERMETLCLHPTPQSHPECAGDNGDKQEGGAGWRETCLNTQPV